METTPAKTPLRLAVERRLYSAGQAAQAVGLSRDALRKMEQRGRIPRAVRETGGDDRLYDDNDIARLRALIVARRLGRHKGARLDRVDSLLF